MSSDAPQRNEATTSSGAGGAGSGAGAGAGNGAANPLDVSWLNSRKDTVGKDKEAELWAAARRFVGDLDQKQKDESNSTDGSEKMQLD